MSKHNHSYQLAVSKGENSTDSRAGVREAPEPSYSDTHTQKDPRSSLQSSSERQSPSERRSTSESPPSSEPQSSSEPRLSLNSPSTTVIVGIPVYNEVATIAGVVRDARTYADEVLVVDDGSDDGTRERARAAGATVVTHDENQGYGAALKTIFQYAFRAGVEQLVILDGDGQHDVSDVPDILEVQQETGAEIVTGSRFRDRSSTEMPLYRQFGLAIINLLTNLGLRIGYSYPSISDTQCGFRAYNRDAIEVMANAPDIGSGMGASIDILFQAAREGFEVVEVPTRINYDVDDANTQNPVFHGLELLVSLFVSVSRDRPARMTAAISLVALSGGGAVLAVGQMGMAGTSVLVASFLAVILVLGVTLSGRFPAQSDSTER